MPLNIRRPVRAVAALGMSMAAAIPVAPGQAAPSPCQNAPQITDVSGDGHHASSDVLATWFSEQSGHLQAVVQVRAGTWVAEHGDAELSGSGFALLFSVGGQTHYVRAVAPGPDAPHAPVRYDYGTYTPSGLFAGAGATTGSVEPGTGGAVTIDVPPATGAVAGATLTDPFVLTYDGINAGVPDWVDHAPGGTDADDAGRGADYVVGSCAAAPVPPSAEGSPAPIASVRLAAPATVTGARIITVAGSVLPARGGVPITLTRRDHGATSIRLTTAADGSFTRRLRIGETTRLRALAAGIASQDLTVRMRTRVRITVRRRRDGSAVVDGRVDPGLPGRVLWLRRDAVRPSARTRTRNGAFRLRLDHPKPGRYQAVVIPAGERAERGTSNTGVIR